MNKNIKTLEDMDKDIKKRLEKLDRDLKHIEQNINNGYSGIGKMTTKQQEASEQLRLKL